MPIVAPRMRPIDARNVWHVTINWSRPRKLCAFQEEPNDSYANLYMVLNERCQGKNKLIYLGMTYQQYVSWRIAQNPKILQKRRLKVSCGELSMADGGPVTKKRVDDTESLLIYVHKPKLNIKKVKWISLEDELWVENSGYRGPLYSHLFYGTFAR